MNPYQMVPIAGATSMASAVFVLLAACQTAEVPGDRRARSATDSTYEVLDAVMPEITTVVEAAWGAPSAWGRPSTDRTSVRLDRTIAELADSPLAGPLTAHTPPAALDSAWIERWIGRGAIQAVCPDSVAAPCKRGAETMVVRLGKPRWLATDSAIVNLEMSREDFAAGFRLIVSRRAGAWVLRAKEMLWIT